jgi:hypothetical protein
VTQKTQKYVPYKYVSYKYVSYNDRVKARPLPPGQIAGPRTAEFMTKKSKAETDSCKGAQNCRPTWGPRPPEKTQKRQKERQEEMDRAALTMEQQMDTSLNPGPQRQEKDHREGEQARDQKNMDQQRSNRGKSRYEDDRRQGGRSSPNPFGTCQFRFCWDSIIPHCQQLSKQTGRANVPQIQQEGPRGLVTQSPMEHTEENHNCWRSPGCSVKRDRFNYWKRKAKKSPTYIWNSLSKLFSN